MIGPWLPLAAVSGHLVLLAVGAGALDASGLEVGAGVFGGYLFGVVLLAIGYGSWFVGITLVTALVGAWASDDAMRAGATMIGIVVAGLWFLGGILLGLVWTVGGPSTVGDLAFTALVLASSAAALVVLLSAYTWREESA